jgi:HTH-type transcriptional regulator / antitoxin HigA
MTQRIPAEVFPPGEFIRDELEAREWTQSVLADVMGRPERVVSEIISGKRSITPDTARGLSAAFGTDPTFWINLEGAYQLSKSKHDDEQVRRRSTVYSYAPVKEMFRRGWVEATESVDVLEQRMHGFFGVSSLTEAPSFCGAAKATVATATTAQLAWAFRVRQIAARIVAPQYSEAALKSAILKLRSLLSDPADVGKVPKILASCGIRFVLVEGLASGKIDGVCFWIDENSSPVVGMSLRFDRIDNFWFVLRHELEHVLRHHGQDGMMLDTDIGPNTDGVIDERELQANAAASDFSVTKAKMDAWVARKSPFFSEVDLVGFAKTQGVHPGIVAGQLRHRIKRHNLFAKFNAKVRSALMTSAIVDGWGETYPIT